MISECIDLQQMMTGHMWREVESIKLIGDDNNNYDDNTITKHVIINISSSIIYYSVIFVVCLVSNLICVLTVFLYFANLL